MSEIIPRAVLWDMDGVLVDSGEYHHAAWRETLARENVDFDSALFRSTFGQRNDTILRGLFGADLSDAEVARIADFKELLYRQRITTDGIDALPGVRHWLRSLQDAGWRQAVASAAPRANVMAILNALDIGAYFNAIASAEDVTRGKPDPQVYLTAAARVGTTPARAIVIEDAPAGLEGARRAGMKCVGVLTGHAQLQADDVVHRLTDLPADAFDLLLASSAD